MASTQSCRRKYFCGMSFFFQFLIFCLSCSNSQCFVFAPHPPKGATDIDRKSQKAGREGMITPTAAFGGGITIARKSNRDSFLSAKPSDDNIVDVEFERVYSDGSGSAGTSSSSVEKEVSGQEAESSSLFDLSLDLDPRWKKVRVPFIDNYSPNQNDNERRSIDVKLAFMVELDGIEYAIAVPFDHCAAITVEDRDKDDVVAISPDDDQNEEIMEIMAKHVKEHLSEDLSLVRTPRVLTIAGDLDNHTKNWQEDAFPFDPVPKELLLDETNETMDFFLDFMKQELGEEEVRKTMQGEDEDEDLMEKEILELFNIPGFGTEEDDTEGVEELLMDTPLTDASYKSLEKVVIGGKEGGKGSIFHDGVALKLISFVFNRDNQSYSLVQLLQPYTLVGRRIPPEHLEGNGRDNLKFELLQPEEEKILIPRLEQVCREDLERAGLSKLFTTPTAVAETETKRAR